MDNEIAFFMNSLSGPFLILDKNLNYIECNEKVMHQMKLSKEQIIGQKLGKHNPQSEFVKIINEFHKSKRTHGLVEFSEATDNSDHIENHYLAYLTKTAGDSLSLIYALSFDISSLKAREKLMEYKRLELAELAKMIILGELASGLAHEINNPLAIIAGRIQNINSRLNKNEIDPVEFRQQFDKILEATDKISRVVRSLKTIGKDSHGVNIKKYQLSELIDPLLTLFSHRFFFHCIEFKSDKVCPDVIVKCSFAEFAHVFLHLINNAVDAIKDIEDKWVRLEYKILNDVIEIWFIDAGKGLAKEVMLKIFEPYFTTKGHKNGSGIGLAAARGLMLRQGGNLFYKEDLPNTCFVIALPLHKEHTLTR